MDFMETIFSKILSMSISACFVIAAVLLLRLFLRKAPRKYSYFLWFLVFIRLLCPVMPRSPFGLVPVKEDAIVYQSKESGSTVKIDTGIEGLDQLAEKEQMISGTREKDADHRFPAALTVWIIGMAALAFVDILQILQLKRKLRTAVLVSSRTKECCAVYESEGIQTAFLMGFIRPRI